MLSLCATQVGAGSALLLDALCVSGEAQAVLSLGNHEVRAPRRHPLKVWAMLGDDMQPLSAPMVWTWDPADDFQGCCGHECCPLLPCLLPLLLHASVGSLQLPRWACAQVGREWRRLRPLSSALSSAVAGQP